MDNESSRILSLGGGSLLIAWQLKDKNVLIVGGGEVASQRIESILTANGQITVISPEDGLHPRTKLFIELRKDRIFYHDRKFEGPDDLFGKHMVLTAVDDIELSRKIVAMSRERRIPVNAADIPELCDFYFGAQIRDGPLQIMISTNGNGPRLASLIRTRLQNGLSGLEGEAIIKVGQLRNKLKERAPGVGGQLGRERMKWMTSLCNTWPMEDFARLDDTLMDKLLDEGWNEKKRVPIPEELGLVPERIDLPYVFASTMPIFPTIISFVAGALTVISLLSYRERS
ncbi:siroheme synthase [Pholiota conissans]|uniref:precorrin-2 dehydrogenase n=1 Tax=Pholiota conissans TaxID=109636 RepID=A0A9P5ZAG1_9AGAR|nr:siroheme synthase [Pholiota conissans]